MIAGNPINLYESEWRLGAHNYKPLDVVLSRGSGVWVWDVDGNRYLDCLSAYSAVNQGHCHPKILAALIEQAGRLTITSRAFRNDQLALLYEKLAGLTGAHKILPMNSGAEAVEFAIKAVRKWGYEVRGVPEDEAEIIVCADNFHGRTIAIVGFSTDPDARNGFGPFPKGFRIVPFGDFAALANAVTPRTVAFLVEPIQGEAGVAIPPPGYFAKVRELCTQKRITLILDEIQTGLGRTGKLLAEEHEGIEADVTLLGKALSGGFYPVSAVLSNSEVLGVLQPGQHGSTFGGNPLACAVACASLDVLIEEGHDRQRGLDRRLSQGRSRGRAHRCGARGARARTDAGHRATQGSRPGARLRRGAGAPWRLDQRRARPNDPHRPAAHRHAAGGRLGDRAICRRAEVGAAAPEENEQPSTERRVGGGLRAPQA